MKLSRFDSTDERRVLTAMIVDSVVLGTIVDRFKQKEISFPSKWGSLVASWCVKYFTQYSEAPKSNIASLFESWASKAKDQETVTLVERFLSKLSGDWETLAKESNSDYYIDLSAAFFNKVRLSNLVETLDGDLQSNEVAEALKRLNDFSKIEMGSGSTIDVMQDKDALEKAFNRQSDVLIQYPGALGNFFGDSLERDGFISFMAPEKRGKTFWLMDLAFRSVLQRRRTAFFAVGDMSQDQMLRRFAVRAARRPLKPGSIKLPTQLIVDPDSEMAEPIFDVKTYNDKLEYGRAWKAFQKACETKIKSHESYLKMSVHPNSSIDVAGIKNIIAGWVRRGWTPDVIVIDYADILAAPSGSGDESRQQTNATWKQLRSLSQSLHCLVVTATQSDADSYKATTLRRSNFSEDKRKIAHVTGMLGINATEQEQELGIYRLNWIALRESKYAESKCVYTAGCLDIANPAIQSSF